MGNNASYLKIKVRCHVICFIYKLNDNYVKRVISAHPDNSFNVACETTFNYYSNYATNYYRVDGNYTHLDNILDEFKPSFKGNNST